MCKCDIHANSTLANDAIDLFIAIYCSNCGDKSVVENCILFHLLQDRCAYMARTGAIRLNIRAFIVAS